MIAHSVAILVYGDAASGRNALTEEKYKDLADAFSSEGFSLYSVLYSDEQAERLSIELSKYRAALVWVNPIEQGKDRKRLDALLIDVAEKGCFVSTHPEVILKMGTKQVLYATKDMEWGGNTELYTSFENFTASFPARLRSSGTSVLKQYRGNGGNGVYKVVYNDANDTITLTHALAGNKEEVLTFGDLFLFLKPFFDKNGSLINQEWNGDTVNGMVRCYVTGTKVSGFGYQEINALYELNDPKTNTYFPPGKRYYFTERCGLFGDLKQMMENKWISELQKRLSITDEKMPVVWDADFFINTIGNKKKSCRYTLCEINVSCVSPFPPSSIPYIVRQVKKMIAG